SHLQSISLLDALPISISKKFNHVITVDLFHGITAFKDKVNYPKNDLVIATSEEEKNIKIKWPNNNEDNIIITGFPRFDDLYKIKDDIVPKKEIFYRSEERRVGKENR